MTGIAVSQARNVEMRESNLAEAVARQVAISSVLPLQLIVVFAYYTHVLVDPCCATLMLESTSDHHSCRPIIPCTCSHTGLSDNYIVVISPCDRAFPRSILVYHLSDECFTCAQDIVVWALSAAVAKICSRPSKDSNGALRPHAIEHGHLARRLERLKQLSRIAVAANCYDNYSCCIIALCRSHFY